MRMKLVVVAALCFSFSACTDLSPNVPKEQTQQGLDRWLKEGGTADEKLTFPKGQQDRAAINAFYAYGYDKTASYAELELKDFKYRENDEDKTHNGKAKLILRKFEGKWSVTGMTLQDGDLVLKEIKTKEAIPVD